MAQNNYQEPIEKEDLDLAKKLKENIPAAETENKVPETPSREKPIFEAPAIKKTPGAEGEPAVEVRAEQVSEEIETTRRTIQSQKPAAAATIQDDARAVAEIQEYEKKVEKLVELALQKGPEHAIRVAEHMNANDNYTMDELHDKMIADDLRKLLIQKGLLKEL